MLTRLRILSVGLFIILAPCHQAGAFLPRGPITVSFEVVVNALEGSPLHKCQTAEELQTYKKAAWWIAIADAAPQTRTGRAPVDRIVRCGANTFEKARADSADTSGHPYLVAHVTTVTTLIRQMEDERVLSAEISLSMDKLSGFDDEQRPVYQPSGLQRAFFFAENGEVFVPLLVASDTERTALKIHDVFLRLAVRMVESAEDAVYGSISVTSGTPEAEILLDGGVTGTVPADGEVTLRNVPAGLREVRVRDTSGHDVRKSVRVEGNRTVLVDLGRRPQPGDAPPFRLAALGRNVEGYEEYRRETDGAVVVRIPAGEFLMGNKDTERTPLEHQIYVSEFLMDKTGVTWSQFKTFAAATGAPLPPHHPYWGIHADHPAVYVTWEEAKAYCEWAGGRLPTEAEREKAARGTDGRKYPWGNEEPDPERGVHRRHWGKEATAAVGTHPAGASPYGLLDMGGNVWEWCADWYDDGYYGISPDRNPTGPRTGRAHVVRGGSWDSRPSVLSASCRSWGHRGYRDGDFGFRCAMNVPR